MEFLRRWVSLQVDLGNFHGREAIYGFAVKMTFRAVLLAFVLSIAALPICYEIGIMPLSLPEAIKLSVAFSWLFGGAVSGALAIVTGHVIHDLTVSRTEFERLSRTDMLSGLLNRRAFNEALAQTSDQASLAILDLDRFKSINDRYGHCAGDAVIKAVGDVLREVFCEPHLPARLGGEEFGVIVRGGGIAQRIALVERARNLIAARTVVCDDQVISTTVSAGIAEFTPDLRSEAVYSAADRALYLAKANGRNRVLHDEGVEASAARQTNDNGASLTLELDGGLPAPG
ncbi:GGDEF domain-containing protein [Rhizobium cremeum]|uniref:GGDEF domain-containing protein n=1 Tax=Rhizobium cremeum TaxID=2813827 RepID=UPI000DDDB7DD|nr:GGDEF domain-containing protein [Rhizobium cremeum]MCJ7997796.1 GGDEF domain-containing protein [Rhizobium cremeum]MCJ8002890.1 GGDEF domain-containing protein [Rhizobium cremeum]